ncbi:unnamed protein product, partial [Rotaria socialis]
MLYVNHKYVAHYPEQSIEGAFSAQSYSKYHPSNYGCVFFAENGEITCFKCTFKTRKKDNWLAHLNKSHRPEFEELKEKQRNSNKVLDDALKNVSDDDKDDDKDDDDDDEHEYLTSDNRTLSRVTTADRFLSSPFVYSSFEQNVATAGSFQFSN